MPNPNPQFEIDTACPDVFLYYRDYTDLPNGNTTVVVRDRVSDLPRAV